MVLTREPFSSLDDSKGPKIVLGDESVTESKGKVGLILNMVISMICCMSYVLLLTSCHCIK